MSSESTPSKSTDNTNPNLQLATISNTPVKVATDPIIPSQPNESTKIFNSNHNNNSSTADHNTKHVDFIGPSKAVRHLFSLPYSTDRNVSVAIHNIGNGTILLDSGEEDGGGVNNIPFGSDSPRPGRRRRPRTWSMEQNELPVEGGEAMKQNMLAQSQDEKRLLASLSLLLEEERDLENCESAENAGNEVNGEAKVHIVDDALPDETASRAMITSEGRAVVSSALISASDAIETKQTTIKSLQPTSTAVNANAAIHGQTAKTTSCVSDPNDPLADKLRPPEHYLSHVVTPPTEPKQYLHWNFQGMNMLVASDANIYTSDQALEGDNGAQSHDNGKSIVLKVADASDLRSQMECHQSMVKSGTVFPKTNTKALPPSSYAEALLNEKPKPDDKHELDGKSLDNVKLQTCIIPSFNVSHEFAEYGFSISPSPSIGDLNATGNKSHGKAETTEPVLDPNRSTATKVPYSSTPCCTVMDTYLDNIMSNVPQLALILREHGFISNIKLMQTEDIPSLLMHPSTLDETTNYPDSTPEPIFSPEIVEMNAAMLLRFLQTNCTKENSTYLLHRSAGDPNLQLFDISSISQLRQRKWIWWLALCSYRFACRLEQLQTNALSPNDKATRREYRKRQRSLLHNTLDLLQELADMDGGKHETISAAVYEHLADTYLWNDETDGNIGPRDQHKPAPLASSSQPYGKVTVDCLNKAHDHLVKAIGVLKPLLAKAKEDNSSIELETISIQMYGMHHKLVNVCLRLTDNHLQSYFSSNLVHSLRSASRMLSDATSLLAPLGLLGFDGTDEAISYTESILLQYSWLWEYCGHFARSFAADELWRERGHTCGNDLLSLFREVDAAYSACFSIMRNCLGTEWKPNSIIGLASHGQVSLKSLTGIVVLPADFEQIERSVLQKEGCHEAISTGKSIIYQKPQIQRDECLVLVAATLCYSNSIDAQRLAKPSADSEAAPPLLFQRLGDACNEIGQILLKSSRQVLVTGLPSDSKGNLKTSHVSAIMLTSAQFWFVEGLEQFNIGKDLRNIALLRCNLCQVCKIRANANVVLPGSATGASNESEQYLQQAVDHLVSAHESLGQRETDSRTWDMVSEELAATLLVLGVRRRQSSIVGASSSSDPLTMKAFRPAPGLEKSIVEPMKRACKIYESLGTARSAQQAAAAHYQLAIYYSKVWTCQRDEAKTREKLASAFTHFGVAHSYYSYHSVGNEPTFVCLSLDFANLYSAVSDREDCLTKALAICVDCRKAFVSDSIPTMRTKPNAKEWFSQMETLSGSIQDRVSKLLMSLVKIEKTRADQDKFKNMYRQVLAHKVASSMPNSSNGSFPDSFDVYKLLEDLATSLLDDA